LGPQPDVITVAGSGEPTLYQDLGELVRRIRRVTRIPLLLITNGTLLADPDVSKDAALFDFVAPSLDAADAKTFARVNGPDPRISLEAMIAGLRSFTAGFGGKVFLEILLVADVNDHPESIRALVEAVGSIRPHQVDLNTVSRPAPGGSAKPVSLEFLRSLEPLFATRCLAVQEAAAPQRSDATGSVSQEFQLCMERVLDSLGRRPGTLSDLATALSFPELLVLKVLDDLVAQGQLVMEHREGRTWYVSARTVS
jgi:wyosine [tRNA(Phe)-imidazoG37] synthetase (radical SAM superfamily)